MKLSATVLENSKNRRVFGNRGNLFLSKNRREAMEDSVINMKDAVGFGELRSVPVVVGGENGRLGFRIYSQDKGFRILISGKNKT